MVDYRVLFAEIEDTSAGSVEWKLEVGPDFQVRVMCLARESGVRLTWEGSRSDLLAAVDSARQVDRCGGMQVIFPGESRLESEMDELPGAITRKLRPKVLFDLEQVLPMRVFDLIVNCIGVPTSV